MKYLLNKYNSNHQIMNLTPFIISLIFGFSIHSKGDLKRIETVNTLQDLKEYTLTDIEQGATDSIKGREYIGRLDFWISKLNNTDN